MRLHCTRALTTALLLLLLPILTAGAQTQVQIESVMMTVYRDGLVHVTQEVSIDELLPEISLPLLSSSVENVIVLDESQLAVDYAQNSTNLSVYSLGATRVSVEYDTITLTNKSADVWTLVLDNPYNLTVILPANSTIIYLNQVPTTIDSTGSELRLLLYPGLWELSYIVPLQQEGQDGAGQGTAIPIEYAIAVVAVASAVIITLILLVWRRRKINIKKILKRNPGLMKEDVAVIEFLAEKDGKAFEAEIRAKFPDMPRTSLWRLVRRLEGLDIVEIKRIGLENQVQLKK